MAAFCHGRLLLQPYYLVIFYYLGALLTMSLFDVNVCETLGGVWGVWGGAESLTLHL